MGIINRIKGLSKAPSGPVRAVFWEGAGGGGNSDYPTTMAFNMDTQSMLCLALDLASNIDPRAPHQDAHVVVSLNGTLYPIDAANGERLPFDKGNYESGEWCFSITRFSQEVIGSDAIVLMVRTKAILDIATLLLTSCNAEHRDEQDIFPFQIQGTLTTYMA